jgi:hypothetical protein
VTSTPWHECYPAKPFTAKQRRAKRRREWVAYPQRKGANFIVRAEWDRGDDGEAVGYAEFWVTQIESWDEGYEPCGGNPYMTARVAFDGGSHVQFADNGYLYFGDGDWIRNIDISRLILRFAHQLFGEAHSNLWDDPRLPEVLGDVNDWEPVDVPSPD